jgi:glycine/D-amino acid oxidase-like deaminating enzyme
MADALVMRLSPDGTRLIFGARPRRFETAEKTAAQDLRRMICGVWPELRSLKIEFCWTGLIGMTTNHTPTWASMTASTMPPAAMTAVLP